MVTLSWHCADVSIDSYATRQLFRPKWHFPPQLWLILRKKKKKKKILCCNLVISFLRYNKVGKKKINTRVSFVFLVLDCCMDGVLVSFLSINDLSSINGALMPNYVIVIIILIMIIRNKERKTKSCPLFWAMLPYQLSLSFSFFLFFFPLHKRLAYTSMSWPARLPIGVLILSHLYI